MWAAAPGDGQRVVHQGTQMLTPGCVPLFLTDGLKDYATALLTHFGHWMHPERRHDKGPLPKPRWLPLPARLYAQVVKSYRRRRIVGVTHRVVFGSQLAIEQLLAACGWTINTAFIARLNLDIRQCVAAIDAGSTPCARAKRACGISCLIPSLSQFRGAPCESAAAIADTGSHQWLWLSEMWWPCTPAMAAGLTDHVWSLKRCCSTGYHHGPGADSLKEDAG